MTKDQSIRSYREGDLDQLMTLWLAGNLKAHSFIDADFWLKHKAAVASALVEADLYICDDGTEIKGFAGVVDGYLAGIFVAEAYQRQGIGQTLLKAVTENYDELVLDVYEKNQLALQFYLKNQFKVVERKIDEATNEVELTLKNKAKKGLSH